MHTGKVTLQIPREGIATRPSETRIDSERKLPNTSELWIRKESVANIVPSVERKSQYIQVREKFRFFVDLFFHRFLNVHRKCALKLRGCAWWGGGAPGPPPPSPPPTGRPGRRRPPGHTTHTCCQQKKNKKLAKYGQKKLLNFAGKFRRRLSINMHF